MGVFINLYVSKAVSQYEWAKVYKETLLLAEKFNFMEIKAVEKFGKDLYCGVPTRERFLWDDKIGWCVDGESATMRRAETQTLYKELSKKKTDGKKNSEESEKFCDPLMVILDGRGLFELNDERVGETYHFFGNKTQGEPYHIGLLAIACLIEDRLNHNAICSGDITYGQCKQAVEYANEYLEKPIGLPLRCKVPELYERIRTLSLNENEIIEAFETAYLGKKNDEYYDFVNKNFSEDEKKAFLNRLFEHSTIGTYGGTTELMKSLNYGFDIIEICEAFKASNPEEKLEKLKSYRKTKEEKDEFNKNPYEMFIKELLDTKVYLKEKDMRDCLNIDEEEEGAYSVATLFAQFMFAGARNHHVARFIPLSELEPKLEFSLADKCDVKKIIAEYIKAEKEKKEESPQKTFNDWRDKSIEKMRSDAEKYDVYDAQDLLFFKKNDSVYPELLKNSKKYIRFYKGILKEDEFADLMKEKGDWEKRCKWLIERAKSLALMESEWDKIFDDIKNNPDSFSRYYPMVRVKITSDSVQHIVRAYVINDDFYEFCQSFGEEDDDDTEEENMKDENEENEN